MTDSFSFTVIAMDRATFIQTYVPLRQTILQVCMALLSNKMDAEDVTQDVLIKLWEQRDSLEQIASPKAYVTRVARNKCIDTLRAPAQRLHNAAPPAEVQMPAVVTTPHEELIVKEQLTRLDYWVESLPAQQQEVWRLRQEQMLTNGEVADRMGLQEVTVRSMISRLRKDARKLWTEHTDARQQD